MTDKIVDYKGYGIKAEPYQLTETKKWKSRVAIYKFTGSGAKREEFLAKERFDSKDDAIKCCFVLGKQEVDKRVG